MQHVQELERYLAGRGISTDAIPLTEYGTIPGSKFAADLLQEILDGEVEIDLIDGEPHIRRVTAVIIVRVVTDQGRVFLLQKARRRNGVAVPHEPFATITETCRLGDDSQFYSVVIRGLEEECGIQVDQSQIELLGPLDAWLLGQWGFPNLTLPKPIYQSVAYPGFWVRCARIVFMVNLSERPWAEEERTIKDGPIVEIDLHYSPPKVADDTPAELLSLIDQLSNASS